MPEVEVAPQALGPPAAGDPTNSQLLARFGANRDEAAFRTLVERYGPLVLDVCRRVLRDANDADDAFQATFLVLARKCGSIQRPELLANWLYGVAYRVATKAKAAAARRREHEMQAANMKTAQSGLETSWRDIRMVLDEEIERLPEKYRAAIVLCDLEGKTHQEAARELAWRPGSMSWRLSRGRELLRKRLARRGLALSASLLALILSQSAYAEVPKHLVETTVRGALHYALPGGAALEAAREPASTLAQLVLIDHSGGRGMLATSALILLLLSGLGGIVFTFNTLRADPAIRKAIGAAAASAGLAGSDVQGGECRR